MVVRLAHQILILAIQEVMVVVTVERVVEAEEQMTMQVLQTSQEELEEIHPLEAVGQADLLMVVVAEKAYHPMIKITMYSDN